MIENRMVLDYEEHIVDYDKYDEEMNALAEKDDERWENILEEEF